MDRTVEIDFYQGSTGEKNALASICKEWTHDEFWPFEEFLVSLRIPGTFLMYQSESSQWLSLALGRAQGTEVELFFIYVSLRARRRGLANHLVKEFCRHSLHDCMAERIILEVRLSNQAAQDLYAKHGFEKIALRKRYYQNGEDALIYEKTLKE